MPSGLRNVFFCFFFFLFAGLIKKMIKDLKEKVDLEWRE